LELLEYIRTYLCNVCQVPITPTLTTRARRGGTNHPIGSIFAYRHLGPVPIQSSNPHSLNPGPG